MDKQRDMFEAWYGKYCDPGFADWFKRDAFDGNEYDMSHTQTAWDAWQAAIAAQSEVLLGWKLVPIVPTEQMLDAAREAAIGWSDGFPDHQECYCVMLSAAPEPTK